MNIQPGDIVDIDGRPMKYLGRGEWQPVGELLTKRFDAAGEEMTIGARESLARYGIEWPACD